MDEVEEILEKKSLVILFYGSCFAPISLACLKYIQKARPNDKGLLFVQGRTATPAYLSKILRKLSKDFTRKITVIPLLDPLHQFTIINMLDTLVEDYSWALFDDFFANILILRGLAKDLRTVSIAFEQILKLKEVSEKCGMLFLITAVEEVKSIIPLDRVKEHVDAVVRVERRNGEITADVEMVRC